MGIFNNIKNFIKKKSYYALYYDRRIPDSDKSWNKIDFLKANDIALYFNRGIQKRADKVGQTIFTIKKGEDETTEKEAMDWLSLLEKPNEHQTGRQFWALYQKYKDLTGVAYIYVEREGEIFKGIPTAMHLLRPDLVKVNRDDTGAILNYTVKLEKGGSRTYDADEIIMSYTPDPLSPLEGVSLAKSGTRTIDAQLQIDQYHSNILKNGGKVEGVFKFKESLTKEQLQENKDQYTKSHAGAKNSGEPLFVGGDVSYEKLGMSPTELSYLESKKMNLDDVSIMTGVPKSILANFSDVKFDNAEVSHTIFLRETIKPLVEELVEVLNWRLIPDKYELSFIDPTPEDVDRKLKMAETGVKNYFITPNEAREMFDLEPTTGGDNLLIPFNLLPQSEQDEKIKAKIKEMLPKKKQTHPLQDYKTRRIYEKLMINRLDSQEKRVRKAMEAYFGNQKNRLINDLEGRKQFKVKNLIDETFNQAIEINIAKQTLLPIIKEIMQQSGDNAMDFSGSGSQFILSAQIENFLEEKADIFSKQINETTFKKLQKEFKESLDANETRKDLIKRIEDTYDGYDKTRAKTIARTEVHGVVQKGTQEGYKQSGVPIKIWVAVMDGDTRHSHQNIDGEEVPLNSAFSNGLMYPSDPSGSAGEVINCRCSI